MNAGLLFMTFVFVGALVIGIPIAFVLGLVPLLYLIFFRGIPLVAIASRLYGGIDNYTLLALPFFILAGNLMNHTGITKDLVNLARLLVGRVRGALAQVNIVVSIIFAGLTGAAVADTAAIGSILVPAMVEEGYSPEYSAAVTATSSIIGPIIPPSIIMVIYSSVTGESVGALFMGGFIPGLLVAASLMVLAYYYAVKNNHPKRTERIERKEAMQIIKRSLVALLVPIIIIGGILSGMFTPTEAAAIACFYAFLVGIFYYRALTAKNMIDSLIGAGIVSATILFIISTSQVFSMVLTLERIPEHIAQVMTTVVPNKYIFLLIVNILLFFMGMIMETGASVILLAPILLPVAISFGIHPLHFALVMLVNLNVGLATPPVGVCLFTVSPIAKVSLEKIIPKAMPFVMAEMVAVFLITYIPDLILLLPRLTGFIN
ncbi:TRAP transporter large permease [Acetomicrobium sp. S15 = DSM 107314]|uniref:TRAP transporter large permease n=1 Tax=Acetomicrobium sp. S15 = DSM 107314 TaxID=2529858 RepID=UPI001E60F5C7|nr:TRAP transporter large permease [Acetomicrobium sp. S15 = DSM 107314]